MRALFYYLLYLVFSVYLFNCLLFDNSHSILTVNYVYFHDDNPNLSLSLSVPYNSPSLSLSLSFFLSFFLCKIYMRTLLYYLLYLVFSVYLFNCLLFDNIHSFFTVNYVYFHDDNPNLSLSLSLCSI